LRFFLREGVQWRELPASDGRVSGSTLRRRLREWRDTAVLARVHGVLLRMARSDPETAARELDVILDSCSVRAKHGGELTGPNPTDRGKRGTKYHIVISSDGLPLGAVASAANVRSYVAAATRAGRIRSRMTHHRGVRISRWRIRTYSEQNAALAGGWL
jgi:hypothetical protein